MVLKSDEIIARSSGGSRATARAGALTVMVASYNPRSAFLLRGASRFCDDANSMMSPGTKGNPSATAVSQPPCIRILLCDDQALVRHTLATWLGAAPDIEVIAETDSADDAIAEVRRHKPDVALLDIDMPGRLSFEAARMIRAISPQTKVIFLSGFCHDNYVEQALSVQASGYLLKGDRPDEIMDAIRKVAAGSVFFSPAVQSRIVIDPGGANAPPERHSRLKLLSRREIEVLGYVGRGLAKKQIADAMHLSTNTIGRHVTSIMNKLDIHDRVELARFAIREGLVQP